MSDENKEQSPEDRVALGLDDPTVEVNPAHPFDEDPEQHIGRELPDPWSDPNADEAWRTKQEGTS